MKHVSEVEGNLTSAKAQPIIFKRQKSNWSMFEFWLFTKICWLCILTTRTSWRYFLPQSSAHRPFHLILLGSMLSIPETISKHCTSTGSSHCSSPHFRYCPQFPHNRSTPLSYNRSPIDTLPGVVSFYLHADLSLPHPEPLSSAPRTSKSTAPLQIAQDVSIPLRHCVIAECLCC